MGKIYTWPSTNLTFVQRLWTSSLPPECWKNAFISGLPSHVRGLLQSSTRMETQTLREVPERARAILLDTKDKHLAAATQPKQASLILGLYKTSQRGLNCFRCRGPNHLARDCMQHSSVKNQRERSTSAVTSATKQSTL